MKKISIQDAQKELKSLVTLAATGEEVVFLKDGMPAAQLLPLAQPKRARKFGTLKGKVHISDDFDAPLPDTVLAEFEGR